MDEGAILSSKFIIINVQEMVELHNDLNILLQTSHHSVLGHLNMQRSNRFKEKKLWEFLKRILQHFWKNNKRSRAQDVLVNYI